MRISDWSSDVCSSDLATPLTTIAIPAVALPSQPRVFLVDQPGAIQANIFIGQPVPSARDPHELELEVANGVLGGEFSSRLNMKQIGRASCRERGCQYV